MDSENASGTAVENLTGRCRRKFQAEREAHRGNGAGSIQSRRAAFPQSRRGVALGFGNLFGAQLLLCLEALDVEVARQVLLGSSSSLAPFGAADKELHRSFNSLIASATMVFLL